MPAQESPNNGKKQTEAPNDPNAFLSQLIQAGMVQPMAQPMMQPSPSLSLGVDQPTSSAAVAGAADGLKGGQNVSGMTGLNTGSNQAGLKPWNREWVMGNDMGLLNTATSSSSVPAGGIQAASSALSKKGELDEARGGLDQVVLRAGESPARDLKMLLDQMVSQSESQQYAPVQQSEQLPQLGQLQQQPQLRADSLVPQQFTILVQPASPMVSQLAALVMGEGNTLSMMEGDSIDSFSMNSGASAPKLPKLMGARSLGPAGVLSGNDFLSTLSGLQSPSALGSGAKQGGMEQGSTGQENAEKGLRLVEGGGDRSKSKVKSRSETETLGESGRTAWIGNHPAESRPQMPGMFSVAGGKGEVAGHVIRGANAEERLSSESLLGVTQGIRTFSAQGGGEMRIRLRPDNLGELSVRVSTRGGEVSLQIQASDDRAKRIIEESMSHLKDRMSAQNLTLGVVELSVGSSQAGSFSPDSQSHSNQHSSGFGQDFSQSSGQSSGQFGGQSSNQQGSDRGLRDDNVFSNPRLTTQPVAGRVAANYAAAQSGRVDVRV